MTNPSEAMGEQLETSVTLGMRSGAIGGLLSTSLGLGAVSTRERKMCKILGSTIILSHMWCGVINRDRALGWERENDAGDLEIGIIFV